MDPCPSGRVIPVRLDELGDRFRRYRLRVPQAVQAMAQSLRRWGQCAPVVATVRDERPQLTARTAFVTGDTLGQASERFLAEARRPFLEKPFLPADVRRLIDELFNGNGGKA